MPIYSVAQVARYLRELLEADQQLNDLWIAGEVSNLTTSQAGHVYFTLKDSTAQLRCVMFRNSNAGSRLLANGTLVVAHAHVNFYEARGEVSVISDAVMPEGTGPLYLELERLKVKLQGEGLFEESRKRPLPPFPKVLGVVTSSTGAALQDIRKIVQSHYPLVELLLAPTMGQGDGAAGGIVAALCALNDDGRADVIIVARGGGSLEELWPFNEEVVARAIHASAIPVISGVGHERDVTIADLVADVRGADAHSGRGDGSAHLVSIGAQVAYLRESAWTALSRQLHQQRQGVATLMQRIGRSGPDVNLWRRSVDDLTQDAWDALNQRLLLGRAELSGLESRVRALDPAAVLARGYAIVEKGRSQEAITSASQVSDGDPLRITLSDGTVPATVGSARPAAPTRRARPQKVHASARLI